MSSALIVGFAPGFAPGFALGLSLIVAIGAQNAFVLRQGLRRQHVLPVALTCAGSDAVLIAAGVLGFGSLAQVLPWFEPAMRLGGAAFLLWYGLRSFQSAWRGGDVLLADTAERQPLWPVLATTLALTWLNPHVYLDTVVLLGSISSQYDNPTHFGLGAVTASFCFFLVLAYGARLLAPVFARPRAWQILEVGIGIIMWAIALRLLLG
ncbi:amino acid transporter [Epibacterium sp. SM1979]|uniref:Amino acid transporter n=1 Tax=Tritonibacter litoralis TaxID=2662264 RepID=A0A843YEH4_9RHOB|nr:LysE/ArgO family amino acid transporter [Tritonibacter litoralis]MQQ07693.1 amino acid transporter [Tritonibacter litoralis]